MTPAAGVGLRYRLVRAQDGREHVDGTVLTEDEAREHLDLEAHLMEAFGFTVERIAVDDYLVAVRACAPRSGARRYVFARSFDPMQDVREEASHAS